MAIKKVLVTGGAGYVGSVLVPRLIQEGYSVKVLDLYLYGEDVLDSVKDSLNLIQIKGDIRDQELLKRSLVDVDAVIHLACISNDPSFELNPDLGKSINFDAFEPLVKISMQQGVKRFIYASSSSVYGVSEEPNVTEDHPLNPMTDYSKFKALCEPVLLKEQSPDFTTVVIRPATVCGYSPRQRLDLSVNILTNHAVNTGKIKVFGGIQKRPNLHIEDMVDLYVQLLRETAPRIAGKIFNAGYQNLKIETIASLVKSVVEKEMPEKSPLEIITTATDDLRSYHISSEKIERELGFIARRTIEDAVGDLCHAFKKGWLPEPMTHSRYFNIKKMQEVDLK